MLNFLIDPLYIALQKLLQKNLLIVFVLLEFALKAFEGFG
jgi:hypothetical protein